jgi:MOSC domain-containing protein YiiM
MNKLISVNVGLPREIFWKGKTVTTGFFKLPVDGHVPLREHNLEGDGQADLSVHGGPTKAVYVYPIKHYDYWRGKIKDDELAWGSFGENFTVDGLDEDTVYIGDEFQVGSARVVVTEPRMPCFKLGIRFKRPDIVKQFLESQRTGFYFGVVKSGMVQTGDHVDRIVKHPIGLSVADVTRLYTTERTNEALLQKALTVPVLPEEWRDRFRLQLGKLRE